MIGKPGKYVELLETNDEGEIAFLESILKTTDIPYYFQNLGTRAISLKVAPAKLMIKETRVEEAKELLKDFRQKG